MGTFKRLPGEMWAGGRAELGPHSGFLGKWDNLPLKTISRYKTGLSSESLRQDSSGVVGFTSLQPYISPADISENEGKKPSKDEH